MRRQIIEIILPLVMGAVFLTACGASAPARRASSTGSRMSSAIENRSLNLYGVALTDARTGWAVGQREDADDSLHAAVLRLASGAWQAVALPDFGAGTALFAVALTDAGDGWAVGRAPQGALIARLADAHWTAQAVAIPHALRAIALDGQGDGWAIGDDGAIARLHAGQWTAVASPTSLALRAVTIAPDRTVWIAGQRGIILHQHGSGWTTAMVPGVTMLTGIAAVNATDLWAIGWHGKLIHGDGDAWTNVPTTHPWPILAIALTPTGGWVVGAGGLMMAYQSGKWDNGDCTTDQTLNALALLTAREGWAVGDGGTILRLQDGAWSQPVPIN
jgi:hypothetical protein